MFGYCSVFYTVKQSHSKLAIACLFFSSSSKHKKVSDTKIRKKMSLIHREQLGISCSLKCKIPHCQQDWIFLYMRKEMGFLATIFVLIYMFINYSVSCFGKV